MQRDEPGACWDFRAALGGQADHHFFRSGSAGACANHRANLNPFRNQRAGGNREFDTRAQGDISAGIHASTEPSNW